MDYQRILVCAPNGKLADRLVAWLEDSGRDTTRVMTFQDAKARLEAVPDLIVAEVKLGEYNGLHLALKAEVAGIPTIVIGPPDAVLEKDASSLKAIYLQEPVTRSRLLGAVSTVLSTPAANAAMPFRAVTTVASEAEVMWRAFSESSESSPSDLNILGRTMLPN